MARRSTRQPGWWHRRVVFIAIVIDPYLFGAVIISCFDGCSPVLALAGEFVFGGMLLFSGYWGPPILAYFVSKKHADYLGGFCLWATLLAVVMFAADGFLPHVSAASCEPGW